jgi:hypothetical protein
VQVPVGQLRRDMSWPVFKLIKENLTDDLLAHGHTGHCYVASEAYYHIVGREDGFQPYQMKVDGVSHWWLRRGNNVIDITSDQFDYAVNYWHEDARCRGFLTKGPSKRAQVLIDRVMEKLS